MAPGTNQAETLVAGGQAKGATPPRTVGELVGIYSELSKARLSALVVATTSAGYLMAGGPISGTTLAATCVGTTLAACSANTFNQVWEHRLDALMNRTRGRPIPSGRISPRHALAWGAASGLSSAAVLAVGANPLTAALGVGNIALYSLVYTPLKQRSEINTWVGAVVGAIPPVMGWTAATSGLGGIEPILLGGALYFWQFPHFFSLAWMYRQDYSRGGYKMVACADATGARTASLVRRYAAYLMPLPLVAAASGATSCMFAVEGTALNAYLLYLSQQFYANPSNASAKRVFMCSLWYLPALLGFMVYHSNNWETREVQNKIKDNLCVHEGVTDRPTACPVVVGKSTEIEVVHGGAANTTVAAAAKSELSK